MVTLMWFSAEVAVRQVEHSIEVKRCGSEWLVCGDLIGDDGSVVEWHAWVTA